MRESSTYQAILEEGRVEGEVRGRVAQARRDILELGTERFGQPDASVVERLDHIDSLDALRLLLRRILRAASWAELFAADSDR